MAEFMTFRRWVITDVDKETEVVALVRDAIVLAYQQLPGCLKLGLLHIVGTNFYLATQHWRSRAAYEAALAAPAYTQWRATYASPLAHWHSNVAHVSFNVALNSFVSTIALPFLESSLPHRLGYLFL